MVVSLSCAKKGEIVAADAISELGSDALADGVEKWFSDLGGESPVGGERPKMVGDAGPVKPLHGRIPTDGGWTEEAAGCRRSVAPNPSRLL